jgi:hypothetical protein
MLQIALTTLWMTGYFLKQRLNIYHSIVSFWGLAAENLKQP